MKVNFRVATLEDRELIVATSKRLRELDELELRLLGGIEYVIDECFGDGEVFIGTVDEEVACVWGVRYGNICDPAVLWIMTTPLIEQVKTRFIRLSRSFVELLTAEHGLIWAYVMEKNKPSDRWLRWMGFHERGREVDEQIGPVIIFERSL